MHYCRLNRVAWLIALAAIVCADSATAQPSHPEPVPERPRVPANPPTTWLTYHLAHPAEDVVTGDPNAAFYWKGRYHLFYIVGTPDSAGSVAGVSWAHVSSDDMVHWQWHPTTLSPSTMGHGLFSGTGFLTREGKPAIIYHGEGTDRNWLAFAEDDQLEKWSSPVMIEPLTESGEIPPMRHWDPDCWLDLDADTYYAISGGLDPHLMKSDDLNRWQYVGRLLHNELPDVGVPRNEDISCPNMFRIGDRWMLLNLSHWLGCRYYLGHFRDEQFVPEYHDLMNWFCEFNQGHEDADLFAPESVLTPDGRRVMWAWSRVRQRLQGVPIQGAIHSLPRELSLPEDGVLRIRPLRELESLRYNQRSETDLLVRSDTVHRLNGISGDALEIKLVIQPAAAREFGISVYCDRDANRGFPVIFQPAAKTMMMGQTRVPLDLQPGADVEMRVFLDKSIIEVFVDDRRAALAPHRYEPENLGVALLSKGGDIVVKSPIAWDMRSIYDATATAAP
jgi:beta-fructofuranosidase